MAAPSRCTRERPERKPNGLRLPVSPLRPARRLLGLPLAAQASLCLLVRGCRSVSDQQGLLVARRRLATCVVELAVVSLHASAECYRDFVHLRTHRGVGVLRLDLAVEQSKPGVGSGMCCPHREVNFHVRPRAHWLPLKIRGGIDVCLPLIRSDRGFGRITPVSRPRDVKVVTDVRDVPAAPSRGTPAAGVDALRCARVITSDGCVARPWGGPVERMRAELGEQGRRVPSMATTARPRALLAYPRR